MLNPEVSFRGENRRIREICICAWISMMNNFDICQRKRKCLLTILGSLIFQYQLRKRFFIQKTEAHISVVISINLPLRELIAYDRGG